MSIDTQARGAAGKALKVAEQALAAAPADIGYGSGTTGAIAMSGYDSLTQTGASQFTAVRGSGGYAYTSQSLFTPVPPGGYVTVFAVFAPGAVAPSASAVLNIPGTGSAGPAVSFSDISGGVSIATVQNTHATLSASKINFQTTGIANYKVTYAVLHGDVSSASPDNAIASSVSAVALIAREYSPVKYSSVYFSAPPSIGVPSSQYRTGTVYSCAPGALSVTIGAPVASYQWYRATGPGWEAISGATSPSYTATAADDYTMLKCLVTWTMGATKISAFSNALPVGSAGIDGRVVVIFAEGQSNMDCQDNAATLADCPQDGRLFEGVPYRYGRNMVDPSFPNGTRGLSTSNATIAVTDGVLTVTATGNYGSVTLPAPGLVQGRTYMLSARMASAQLVGMSPGTEFTQTRIAAGSDGYLRVRFIARKELTRIIFTFAGTGIAGETMTVQDVQLREIINASQPDVNAYVEPNIGPAPLKRASAYGRGSPAGWFARRVVSPERLSGGKFRYSGAIVHMCAVGGTAMLEKEWDITSGGYLAAGMIGTMKMVAEHYAPLSYVDFVALASGHESDAQSIGNTRYGVEINAANCTNRWVRMIEQSRWVDGLSNMKWIVGGMSPEWIALDATPRQDYETNVLAALPSNVSNTTYRVSASGLSKAGDPLHFSGYPGQQVRGYDWADNWSA